MSKMNKKVLTKNDRSIGCEEIKITDVNTDCLEQIFNLLPMEDLVNLSNTSSHFKEAADIVISRKFAKKALLINDVSVCQAPVIDEQSTCIKLSDLGLMFQVFRCFGHLIRELRVCGKNSVDLPGQTMDFRKRSIALLSYYIGHYCGNSLNKLIITKEISFNILNRRFLKVEMVQINSIHSYRDLLKPNWFNYMFPNVRHLKYGNADTDFHCIVAHFPKLEHLDISYEHSNCRDSSSTIAVTDHQLSTANANIIKSLSLNPQLKKLALPYTSDIQILRSTSEQLRQLEYLSFRYGPTEKHDSEMNTIRFSSIKRVKIYLCSPTQRRSTFGSADNEMMQIPFLFENLNALVMRTCYRCTDEFFKFIEKHKTITTLDLRTCGWPQVELANVDRVRLGAALPQLKEINFQCHTLTVYDAVGFIEEFQQLEKFRFKLELRDDYKFLLKHLTNKWQSMVCSHGTFVTLNRIDSKMKNVQ